jgi:hypothetical protein
MNSFFALVALIAFAGGLNAQIAVNQKLVNEVKPAPRVPDGKPELSGVWGVVDRAPGINTTAREESALLEKLYGRIQNERPSRTPWAEERWLQRRSEKIERRDRRGFGAREGSIRSSTVFPMDRPCC